MTPLQSTETRINCQRWVNKLTYRFFKKSFVSFKSGFIFQRKRKKNYKKHSRSGSKASLKEFFLENATTPVPHSDNIVAPNEAVTSSSDAETRVRHKSSTETSLLLSRLPVEPEIMDSIATDDQEIKQIETEPPRSSLPINIERQFSYFRFV